MWDDIENHCFEHIKNELEEICNVSINHSTVSEEIYKRCKEDVSYGYSSIMIRCNNDNYSKSNPSGTEYYTETRTEFLVGFSKENNKGFSNQPRNQKKILDKLWKGLRDNPMFIRPVGICKFNKSGKRIVFDSEDIQILSFETKIKYID